MSKIVRTSVASLVQHARAHGVAQTLHRVGADFDRQVAALLQHRAFAVDKSGVGLDACYRGANSLLQAPQIAQCQSTPPIWSTEVWFEYAGARKRHFRLCIALSVEIQLAQDIVGEPIVRLKAQRDVQI